MSSLNNDNDHKQICTEKQLKKGTLKSNFFFNFISQILTLIIPLITTPYLARVLGTDVNGQIGFSSSIVTYFTLAANFGFSVYGQREIAKYQNDERERSKAFEEIFFLRLLFSTASLAAYLGIVFSGLLDSKYQAFLAIQIITIVSCAFDPTFYYQGAEDFKSLALRTISIKLISLICVFIFVKKAGDAWIYVLVNAVSILLSYLIMLPGVSSTTRFIKFKELNIWKRFWPAFLIFLPNLAIVIYSVLDQTMIGLLSSNPDYENGCYEQAYKINSAILLLVTVISPAMIPRNAHDYAIHDYNSLKKHLLFAVNYVWIIGIPLIVGCAIMAPSLSSWFLGKEYEEVPLLLQIMSVRFVVSGFFVIFSNQLFIAIGKEKYSTIATFAGAIINFSLNYFFIQWKGATGAAIATAICETVVCLILGIIAFKKKFFNFSSFFKPLIKPLIASLFMFFPIFFMNRYLTYSVWTFIIIVLVGIITYILSLIVMKDSFLIMLFKKEIYLIKSKFSKRRSNKNDSKGKK
jgi:O-antigen/teichoic acid export membrane protein